jgi:hypothetical protein
MSEFSESYHMRGGNINEGVALLRRAGLKGYVFPSANGWISIVAEQNSFAPDPRILAQNEGSLLHYVSAEDHGWCFALFVGEQLVSAYDCAWDDEVRVDDSHFSKDNLIQILGTGGEDAAIKIERILHPQNIDEAIDSQPSRAFAEAMGLPRFEWFAYDYVARDFHESPDDYVGVIEVT